MQAICVDNDGRTGMVSEVGEHCLVTGPALLPIGGDVVVGKIPCRTFSATGSAAPADQPAGARTANGAVTGTVLKMA